MTNTGDKLFVKMHEIFKEKSQLRCPFCNITDCPPIAKEDWEEEYKKGFRYYCHSCCMCFFEPVVNLSDIRKALKEAER
jgi:hypothetical protein